MTPPHLYRQCRPLANSYLLEGGEGCHRSEEKINQERLLRAENPKVFNLVGAHELQLIFLKILRPASDDLTYDKSLSCDGCPAEFFFGVAVAVAV